MSLRSLPALTDRPRQAIPKGAARVELKAKAKADAAAAERACRKAVDRRDGRRCRFPGCNEHAVHKHHLVYRSKGGRWTTGNVVSVCAHHHGLIHAGVLQVTGDADARIQWREGR